MSQQPPHPDPDAPRKPGDGEDFVARYRREEAEAKGRASVAGIGLEFAVAVALFTLAGWGLDRWLGLLPLFTLIGFALGFSVAFFRLYAASKQMMK